MYIPFLNYTLRSLSHQDGPQIFALIQRNRKRLRDYFPVTSATITTLDAAFKFIDEKMQQAADKVHYTYVIEDANKQLQGVFFIKNLDWRIPKGELAYFIDEALTGKGIMTKALGEVINHSFNSMGMNKLYIITTPDNHASRKIAEKNGFMVEGHLRKNFRLSSGELVDNVYYGIIK
jgi:RimJ/RimL family protein N-acetyltransferase